MSGLELSKHRRWPLYRKVRRHAAAELRKAAKPSADPDVDVFLAAELRPIADDLLRLYMFDVSERGARDRIKGLLDIGDGFVAPSNQSKQKPEP